MAANGFDECIGAYSRLDPDVRRQIPFIQFHNTRSRTISRGEKRHPNRDLQQGLSKLTLPTIDGSRKVTAQAWGQKLDTYLSLIPMTNVEVVKFAILHLEGTAHE